MKTFKQLINESYKNTLRHKKAPARLAKALGKDLNAKVIGYDFTDKGVVLQFSVAATESFRRDLARQLKIEYYDVEEGSEPHEVVIRDD